MKNKLNYLNLGCGKKFHNSWVNVDMTSNSKDVQTYNLLKGIPFSDNSFEVIYHSHFLEHLPKEKAADFIKECNRVLKTDGIIRVVVPDLENIVDEYKKFLKQNLENPNEMSEVNYEWIMMEMYDQTVRNYSGGQMSEFLKRDNIINEKYVLDRIGHVGRNIRDNYLKNDNSFAKNIKKVFSSPAMFRNGFKYFFNKIFYRTKVSKIGKFRLGGEIHMWMYDRYSLQKLLKDCGFVNISLKNPYESYIPNWSEYQLDVKDGLVIDPTSLFMEAQKK
ncbi:MAG: methyltransferase domain-containing protein [Marinilabiliaceae bacterium]|nr:methyltransferase domain-containing protein [Marinilabiliaceae bacterium]